MDLGRLFTSCLGEADEKGSSAVRITFPYKYPDFSSLSRLRDMVVVSIRQRPASSVWVRWSSSRRQFKILACPWPRVSPRFCKNGCTRPFSGLFNLYHQISYICISIHNRGSFLSIQFKLSGIKLIVFSMFFHQLLMAAAFNDAPLL